MKEVLDNTKTAKEVNYTLPEDSPICSQKIRLTNVWDRDTLFVSLYPQPRTKKPTDIGIISTFIAGFPNVLTLEQLKEEVAKNGKSFIGAFFFDVDFYKTIYGDFSFSAITKQTRDNALLLWASQNLSFIQSRINEEHLLDEYNNLTNSVRLKKEYFILLSTFRFRCRPQTK